MSQIIATQISMYDYLARCRDEQIHNWGIWRDSQGFDDAAKQLVDDVWNEYIRTLDNLMETVLPF